MEHYVLRHVIVTLAFGIAAGLFFTIKLNRPRTWITFWVLIPVDLFVLFFTGGPGMWLVNLFHQFVIYFNWFFASLITTVLIGFLIRRSFGHKLARA
ncbi:MAG: hypothetical protein PVG63_08085 [Anaerolineales bacterium]|jgi:hypothetical protein